MKMRIMTNKEWDRLVDLTGRDNAKMHWKNMSSWVKDDVMDDVLDPSARAVRGYRSTRYWSDYGATGRVVGVGFRPAIDTQFSDPLLSVKEGQSAIVGTLYMNGKPVRVPENPTCDGDIADYVPGATLEMGAPIPDPAYQVVGIRVGDAFIADCNMLKMISFEDIKKVAWDFGNISCNYSYSPSKDGVVVAARLFFAPNHITPMAELIFAFGGSVTIEWANENQRKEYEAGINAYTIFFDERFPTRTFESFKKE